MIFGGKADAELIWAAMPQTDAASTPTFKANLKGVSMYQLDEVLALAKKANVGFSCVYSECDSSWYFSVESIVPSEQWVGKNRSFEGARDAVLAYLNGLASTPTLKKSPAPMKVRGSRSIKERTSDYSPTR